MVRHSVEHSVEQSVVSACIDKMTSSMNQRMCCDLEGSLEVIGNETVPHCCTDSQIVNVEYCRSLSLKSN